MKNIRNIIQIVRNRKGVLDRPNISIASSVANQLIFEYLQDDRPRMIARLGAFETAIAQSVFTPFSIKNLVRFVNGEISGIGLHAKLVDSFCNNAGFFPKDSKLIERFAQLLADDMTECDILGSWQPGEKFFAQQLQNSTKIKLSDLEPFHHKHPWTKALQGRRVLIIHPYEDSIRHQWQRRKQIFNCEEYLPDFDLQIIKAVQSAGGSQTRFDTWFDALDWMKSEIDNHNFDIALIGCGAYGFHLAAHIKRIGKKAVHLGGVLQILFGIMGKRWEGKYDFVNDYWIRPLPSDIIANADTIENGCYW